MAKSLTYKKQQSITLKASGLYDADKMTIEIDGEEKDIKTLAKDFNGLEISLTIQVKQDEELDEPNGIVDTSNVE